MTFYEVLEQVLALLQRHGQVTYRALKRQFPLDDDYIEDLKADLIQARYLAVDEEGAVLIWSGGAARVVSDIVYVPIRIPVCRTCGERYYDRQTIRLLEVDQKLREGKAEIQAVGKVMMYG